jgi:hypothetical protein
MKYLKFTYVDRTTGVSVATEPAMNGTKFPAVPGLAFVWARESAYPTPVPEFFGTCPDEANSDVPGVLGAFVESDWLQMQADEIRARPQPLSERDLAKAARTLAVANITVTTKAGHTFDGDETSQDRMTRAIVELQVTGKTTKLWVLHDNSSIEVSAAELGEALALAGAAQSEVWVLA